MVEGGEGGRGGGGMTQESGESVRRRRQLWGRSRRIMTDRK